MITRIQAGDLLHAAVEFDIARHPQGASYAEKQVAESAALPAYGKILKAVFAPKLPDAVHDVILRAALDEAHDGFVATTSEIERHYASKAALAAVILATTGH